MELDLDALQVLPEEAADAADFGDVNCGLTESGTWCRRFFTTR